jgi:hypothetical protein
MKTLETVYWLRFCFGILAAFCDFLFYLATKISGENLFFNSASIAIIVYAVTYYAIKPKFAPQLQKPQKLLTAGIGIYFLSWIVFWSLFYTIFTGATL